MTNDITASTSTTCRRRVTMKRVTSDPPPQPSPSRGEGEPCFETLPPRGAGKGGGCCEFVRRSRCLATLDAPLFDPQRRRVLVAGGCHALEPFRQHIGVGAEEQRQRR